MKLSDLGEDVVVARLTKSLSVDERVKLGAGDDCAVVEPAGGLQLLKADCLIEGIHFSSDADPRAIGWKAMCRPISDIAAMGGTPLDALVTVAVCPETEFTWLKRVYAGLEKAAKLYHVNLVGGETSKSPGPVLSLGCADRNGRSRQVRSTERWANRRLTVCHWQIRRFDRWQASAISTAGR